ncbi:MAG: hypothetical protein IH888_06650 [Planctomycetes bacterium]|nr:hypothetical protein [Planctomycetota bacterium]
MSKIREHITLVEGDLDTPIEGDLEPYVIFTQLATGRPYIYAGWVDAIDAAMAIQFGREHYGQDQKCVGLWAIPKPAITAGGAEMTARGRYEVFLRAESGEPHRSAGCVEAESSREALDTARRDISGAAEARSIWVALSERIVATGPDDVIWRLTDQTYRMARGYASEVRAKWEEVRARKDIEEYEKDDLKEMF